MLVNYMITFMTRISPQVWQSPSLRQGTCSFLILWSLCSCTLQQPRLCQFCFPGGVSAAVHYNNQDYAKSASLVEFPQLCTATTQLCTATSSLCQVCFPAPVSELVLHWQTLHNFFQTSPANGDITDDFVQQLGKTLTHFARGSSCICKINPCKLYNHTSWQAKFTRTCHSIWADELSYSSYSILKVNINNKTMSDTSEDYFKIKLPPQMFTLEPVAQGHFP